MSSPVSYTATIDGWFSEAADCASRRNRAWNVVIAREVRAQRLDRHDPVQPQVPGAVHLCHATTADDTFKFIAVSLSNLG